MARVDWPRYFYICECAFWATVFWADDSYEPPEEIMKYMRILITTNVTFAIIMLCEWYIKGRKNVNGISTWSVALFVLQCINNLVLHIVSYTQYDMDV